MTENSGFSSIQDIESGLDAGATQREGPEIEKTPQADADCVYGQQTETDKASDEYYGTCMDDSLYEAAAKGIDEKFKEYDKCLDKLMTPNGNSILHIFITALPLPDEKKRKLLLSEDDPPAFVKWVSEKCPDLLKKPNNKRETPLHIAARHGHSVIVKFLALFFHGRNDSESLRAILTMKNTQGDTPLHEAAKYNHFDTVFWLIVLHDWIAEIEIRPEANSDGETPLYLAAEKGYSESVIAMLTASTSPIPHHGPNRRTALHAAVIRNDERIATLLMDSKEKLAKSPDKEGCQERTPAESPDKQGCQEDTLAKTPDKEGCQERTPAESPDEQGCQEDTLAKTPDQEGSQERTPAESPDKQGCQEDTLAKTPDKEGCQERTPAESPDKQGCQEDTLAKSPDTRGWIPLHYAAYYGYLKIVELLIKSDKSLAYIPTKTKSRLAIHLAAAEGHKDVIKELVSKCPRCADLTDEQGWNVLHFAVASEKEESVRYIINNPWLRNIVNEKNKAGDTPLHQLANTGTLMRSFITHHKVDKLVFNRQNLTALDIISNSDDLWGPRKRAARLLKRFVPRLGLREKLNNPVEEGNDRNKVVTEGQKGKITTKLARDGYKDITEYINDAREAHIVAAILIATVTFAAGFTLPGGYKGAGKPEEGSPILTRRTAFQAFMILDAIAMTLSCAAVFIHLFMALGKDKTTLIRLFQLALYFTVFALFSMMAAFITGTYAVLVHSRMLAFATVVLCCLFFIICLCLPDGWRSFPDEIAKKMKSREVNGKKTEMIFPDEIAKKMKSGEVNGKKTEMIADNVKAEVVSMILTKVTEQLRK